MMVSLAEIAVISFVNRFGSSATAAYGAVNQVVGYVQFPAISIGIAASIFGAQCIGARREDKLGSVIRSAVGLNYAIGAVIIGACYVFAWNRNEVFQDDWDNCRFCGTQSTLAGGTISMGHPLSDSAPIWVTGMGTITCAGADPEESLEKFS